MEGRVRQRIHSLEHLAEVRCKCPKSTASTLSPSKKNHCIHVSHRRIYKKKYLISYFPVKYSGKQWRPTDLVGRLSKVNQHWSVVSVLSFCVVPHVVAAESISVLVYQYIPTHTCINNVLSSHLPWIATDHKSTFRLFLPPLIPEFKLLDLGSLLTGIFCVATSK